MIRTDLTGANLSHANLNNADLTRARMLAIVSEHMTDSGANYTLVERE